MISENISQAADLLRKGDVVAIPTETVYGLAANALNADAVIKIFSIKNRPHFDPLIVHVASLEKVADLVTDFPPKAQSLAKKFWPGPLTIVLKKKAIIPDIVTAGLDTVGIRLPDHAMTIRLLNELDFPLAAPSANPFGYISPTSAEHVVRQLGEKIPMILDGGNCRVGLESTIVDCTSEIPVILRLGGITQEQITACIGEVTVMTTSTSNPQAPGMLLSHYAPHKKIIVGVIKNLLAKHSGKKIAILSFEDEYPRNHNYILSEKADLSEAAKNLFAALRELDNSDAEIILAEWVPNVGVGKAINDKLRRASS